MKIIKIIFWILIIGGWSIIEILYRVLTGSGYSNLMYKLFDKLENTIWTKKELMNFEIDQIEKKYANKFLFLNLDFDGYTKFIQLRNNEIDEIKKKYNI